MEKNKSMILVLSDPSIALREWGGFKVAIKIIAGKRNLIKKSSSPMALQKHFGKIVLFQVVI